MMWTLFLLPLLAATVCSQLTTEREVLWINCSSTTKENPIQLNIFSQEYKYLIIRQNNMSTLVLDMENCCNVTEQSLPKSCRPCENGTIECELHSHENLTLNLEKCAINYEKRIWCEQRSIQPTVSVFSISAQTVMTSFLSSSTDFVLPYVSSSISNRFSTVIDITSTPASMTPALISKPASISTLASTSALVSTSTLASIWTLASTSAIATIWTLASTSAIASIWTFASISTLASSSSDVLSNEQSIEPTSTQNTQVSSTQNSTNAYVETSTAPAQESHSLKNLYTFLIVAGVLFLLVILLVCFFFCRKTREKASISHVDYPLEYWHDREYIEGVVEKSYCPTSSSLVINPVYENGKGNQAATAPTQRYRKKEDSLDRRSNQQRKPSDHLKRSNANRQRSNGSSEGPRKARRDHAENYVATAAGSNFYQYDQPARAEPRTNLDDDSTYNEVDLGNPGPANITGNGGTSSFRPASREGRRKRRAPRGPGSRHSDWESEGERADHEVYAISYKNRLQKNLDDWSAEESDV
ncbi:uncharacterized protein LOC127851183 [Dreissena polymorpha]|uniref:Uncharacterized protein n=1 Tax=Dreissena polymorpha TaxID=45954 RepID=A0A9D4CTI7_DREPO|nr:uncharacterized protein LOC127851183 [Dreissena polymorpha]KAH3733127.1 hypothetical protein DPMN_039552 [Dreissena polymorpha]